ncbi:MAG: thioredoxin-dependent thiol peroxidase [Verrucomicrobia bacterium Tous-C9LFEB]|nr:MAG: thioredoxin-dependent thiol peroxidase [Verrucomicrobia bacterium Tous-C9LFEB]
MKTLAEGSKAPAFQAETQDGKTVTLADFAGKTVVLYFYPKDSTPGCTTEACSFRDSHSALLKKGVVVLGVSPDSVKSHANFAGKNSLPFPLLADVDKKIVEAYGVWVEKSLYGRKYMGVERSTFVIGPDGKIVKIFRKVKAATHVAEVLEAIS